MKKAPPENKQEFEKVREETHHHSTTVTDKNGTRRVDSVVPIYKLKERPRLCKETGCENQRQHGSSRCSTHKKI